MILEQQVCSLELAKRLKELGVKQNSLVYWLEYKEKWELKFLANDLVSHAIRQRTGNGVIVPKDIVSAFTVAELGEILSSHFNEWAQGWNDSGCFWHFQFGGRGCGNMMEGFGQKFSALDEDTEADARAKMLIYLLENKLITL